MDNSSVTVESFISNNYDNIVVTKVIAETWEQQSVTIRQVVNKPRVYPDYPDGV